MRTVVTEEVVYSWEDVKNDAELLEKVLDKNRHIDVESGMDWWDCVYYDFISSNKHFNVKDIMFSGFWSQGDGAMFEYDYINDEIVDEFIASLSITPMRKGWLKNNANFYGKGKHQGHYQHENCCNHSIGVEVDNGDILYGSNFRNWIDSFDNSFFDFVVDKYKDMCRELYRDLEKSYDYLTSDQSVADTLEANDYEFNINGEII
jgi:hypothetical protein